MLVDNVVITDISHDYKGICYIEGVKCFVDEAVIGDEVNIDIYKKTKNYYVAKIINITKSSEYRNNNILCPYYKKCGGCSLQHIELNYYHELKKNNLKKLLGIDDIIVYNATFGERRRIDLKYKNGMYGFFEKGSKNIVPIDSCINLTSALNNVIKKLQGVVLTNLNSVQLFECSNGVGVNFIFNQDPILDELKKLQFLRDLVTSANYTYLDKKSFIPIIKNDDLYLELNDFKIKLPKDFFMQATKNSQDFMIKTVCNEIKDYNNVYDLYCGIGTYSFPMTRYNKKVTCFEGSDFMINSIKENSLNIGNLFVEKKDLFNQPIVNFKDVDAVVINPPRNGAGNQCKFLKEPNKIVYVSCNPETFKKDFDILKNYYKTTKTFLVDQFFYSNHIEIIVVLEKNI